MAKAHAVPKLDPKTAKAITILLVFQNMSINPNTTASPNDKTIVGLVLIRL